MNFTLSTAAVVETVQALAAFDVLYNSSPSLSSEKSPVETSRFASLLDPDRRDLLHSAVKDSFAEIVLLLLDTVAARRHEKNVENYSERRGRCRLPRLYRPRLGIYC